MHKYLHIEQCNSYYSVIICDHPRVAARSGPASPVSWRRRRSCPKMRTRQASGDVFKASWWRRKCYKHVATNWWLCFTKHLKRLGKLLNIQNISKQLSNCFCFFIFLVLLSWFGCKKPGQKKTICFCIFLYLGLAVVFAEAEHSVSNGIYTVRKWFIHFILKMGTGYWILIWFVKALGLRSRARMVNLSRGTLQLQGYGCFHGDPSHLGNPCLIQRDLGAFST